MFWKRKSEKPPLFPHREECNRIAAAALRASGVDFDRASQLEQALVGTFIFGMIQTEGMMRSASPEEVHAVSLCVFQDTLHYTPQAAAEGVHACIEATDPKVHATMNDILHRGIDGHAQYFAGDSGL